MHPGQNVNEHSSLEIRGQLEILQLQLCKQCLISKLLSNYSVYEAFLTQSISVDNMYTNLWLAKYNVLPLSKTDQWSKTTIALVYKTV